MDYGASGGAAALPLAGQTFTLSHTYVTAGPFTVTVRVSDDDVTSVATAEVTVISAAQAIQNAAAMIDALVAAQKLEAKNAKTLKVKLSGAVKDINNGDTATAVDKVESTIDQLDALVASGRLAVADAAPVRALLARVIQSLT